MAEDKDISVIGDDIFLTVAEDVTGPVTVHFTVWDYSDEEYPVAETFWDEELDAKSVDDLTDEQKEGLSSDARAYIPWNVGSGIR